MGYIGQKRSVRSQEAVDRGMLTYSQLRAWQKRAVDRGAVVSKEWHHTGKYFNQTKYYDPTDFEDLNPKDFPPVKKTSEDDTKKYYVLISAVWEGTRRHPRIKGFEYQIKERITDRQRFARKYSDYNGEIKVCMTAQEAEVYGAKKTAELNSAEGEL